MADLTALTLPVLPLTTGVVLPQMVVTIALETDEAKAAAEAAGDDGPLLLVPRIDGRYATVGVDRPHRGPRARCPTAPPALVVRAERPGPRAAPASSAPARALWVAGRAGRRRRAADRAHRRAGPRATGRAAGACSSASAAAA